MNPLPTKTQLLHACRGIDYADHPILHAAHALTGIHESHLAAEHPGIPESKSHRARLITEIDRHVARSLPPAPGSARIHTETIGAVVDRMAHFTAIAYAALAGSHPTTLGDVWEHLAELAVGYEDLIDELHTGRRRLPGSP
ncbi:DUF4254 domain-containing protein [Nocardia sp. CDC159]|uniref:DUF4254 domain-containing protein n=1 Tax=Nocardia pulmonis TaxID=2951408 RepID=A0A9X2IVI2_9NOCA|nr:MULTISPECIES: DUF4254 domain-containing protein [Nocardia]MCM6773932.1 DUF4254 domain-containing protein [Nocardia pulmonis]MCM6786819.1 DUF4254 domain-containing protein [Nocardia sp. CDC159]